MLFQGGTTASLTAALSSSLKNLDYQQLNIVKKGDAKSVSKEKLRASERDKWKRPGLETFATIKFSGVIRVLTTK